MPSLQLPEIPELPVSMLGRRRLHGKPKLIIIDDDPDFAEALKERLERYGSYSVSIALDPFEGANAMADQRFDVVVTDCILQDWDGLTTLENADHLIDVDPTVQTEWERTEPSQVFLCSASPVRIHDLRRSRNLKHFSVLGFLRKSTGLDAMTAAIQSLSGT